MSKAAELIQHIEKCEGHILGTASADAIYALLDRVEALREAAKRFQDNDCGDHCANSCKQCQLRRALDKIGESL